jgi:osmoprotectant transport system permease protein
LTPLGSIVGSGGFGEPILRGIAANNQNLIIFGAIPVATLAILIDRILLSIEKSIGKKYKPN